MSVCKAKTKSGAPCRAAAVAGTDLCFLHANPERVKKLAQQGGRANRRAPLLEFPLTDNPSPAELLALNAHAIRLVLTGDLRPREASALAQLCNSMMRLMPTANLEIRVAALEAQIAHQEMESADPSDASDRQVAELASREYIQEGDEESNGGDESHGV